MDRIELEEIADDLLARFAPHVLAWEPPLVFDPTSRPVCRHTAPVPQSFRRDWDAMMTASGNVFGHD
jgi:hypothetical protein